MPSGGLGGSGEASDRVTRGFEALVGNEGSFTGSPGSLTPPFASGPVSELARLDALEDRVRVTMDRLTELVEAQLPEAVDGLRSDFELLRAELQDILAEANDAMADEREQLRAQIATTVGAANRWFVRTRDQIYERLDHIADVAGKAHAEAEAAAIAAAAAAVQAPGPAALVPAPPDEAPAEPQSEEPEAEREWEVEGGLQPRAELEAGPEWEVEGGLQPRAELEAGPDLAREPQQDFVFEPEPEPEPQAEPEPQPEPEPQYDGEIAFGFEDGVQYDLEAQPEPFGEEFAPAPQAVISVAVDAPELEALMEPLRRDVQELQGEVAAMGGAVMQLRAEIERLMKTPTRAPATRLTPSQVEAIAAAVRAALPAKTGTRAASATKRAGASAKKAAANGRRRRTTAT